ncbi:uncharacterized protein LOC122400896 [Colletes gigas]|uniref:uncharacterized protein LOC122400896 n=1 Tax=Colletes gigas TaxID=935657 RepID=UPI001C9AC1EB|nr:uncharacterized protein LOC122400896 [Colletes gigas]
MEPTFQFYFEDIDIMLANVKRRLMLQDETAQITCVERISNLFKSGGAAGSEEVLSKLIKYDVLSTVFEIIHTPSDRLLPCILDFLSLISAHQKFYEQHVVMDAMDAILKVAICVFKSRCKETQLLEKLIQAIHNIVCRAVEFNVELNAVCVPRQILCLLKSLILDDKLDKKLKFPAVAVLNVVLENVDVDELEDSAFEICHKALSLMKDIVEYSDDDASITLAANALCAVCASGARLCKVDSNVRGIFDKVQESRASLTKMIYQATMNTLIPYVKNTEPNETDGVRFHASFVTCLNSLYKLANCSHDNLSNHLTANGYLKYFLLLTARLPENLRRSTCALLSRIITTLGDKSLSIGQWPGGTTGFENLMHRGLLDLPRDSQRWDNVVAHRGNSAIALMVLIYYHYHGTRENMICLRSLISGIVGIPKSEQISEQLLKVLWFLFAVASVSHPSPNSEQDYSRAATRLAVALQYSRLNDCYTHHIDLLRYCLKCPDVPRDLRNKALDLWLVESDGDIEPLLTLDCDQVVRHYLLLVIQNGYSERIINLAMKGIREMIRVDNAKEIAEIAWHMLPTLLSTHRQDKDEQIKAVLELTNIFIPNCLSPSVRNRCADSLVAIVLRRDADLKLRTLAVMQSYVLMVTSATFKPFTIFERCIATPNFLEELLVQGFSEDTPELSAVCLKLIAFIIHCQEKSSVKRDKSLTIDAQSLADLLFNARKSLHCSINGMQLALELLTQNIEEPAIRLEITNSSDRANGVVNLYETLHMMHGKSDPMQRDLVYQCLEGVITFCHKHVEFLLCHVCTSMSNDGLVASILATPLVSCHFLEFVSTWLRCRRRYCNDEAPWNERSLRKTPFEETVDRIRKYVDATRNSRTDAGFNSLLYAVGPPF